MITLRDWQRSAVDAFLSAGGRGFVEVATGAGKTIFAMAAFAAITKQRQAKLLVLVPTRTLVDQWLVLIQTLYPLSTAADDVSLTDPDFVVMTYAKAQRRSELLTTFALHGAMLVLDEVHAYGAPRNRALAVSSFPFVLGLSATPERPYDEDFSGLLMRNIGPKVYTYSVQDAIGDGVLVPFQQINVEVPMTAYERSSFEKYGKSIAVAMANNDVDLAKRLSIRRARVERRIKSRSVVATRIALDLSPRKTLVFFEDISMARDCLSRCRTHGLDVVAFDSAMSPGERRSSLLEFQYGIATTIVACRALDEGFDVPSAECAVIAASTRSRRQRIQRIGRVLRIADRKVEAEVYSLYATEHERRSLASAFGAADAAWRRVTFNE